MRPSRDGDDRRPDAGWCADVAAVLAAVSTRAGRLASAIAEDWRDGHGQDRAERATLLHRELGRVAAEAADLGTALARAPDPLPWPGAAVPGRLRGPRLGSTAGAHADSGLGMRIAELPPP